MKEVVPASLAGERVDRVVAVLTGLPRASVAELVTNGEVLVSGKPAKSRSLKVQEGQEIEVDVPEEIIGAPEPNGDIAFDVVYEDDDLFVINKPPGVVVHPGNGHHNDTLVNGLVARFPDFAKTLPGDDITRAGIVHRLDVGTSGLLVVARSERAYAPLVAMMKSREVGRRYTTLVWGDVQPVTGTIDAPIGRSDRDRKKMAVASGGRHAITHYAVKAHCDDPDVTLVDVRLETGRTHQIRVHFSAIGHAVVGDARYRGQRAALIIPRPFLHAHSLEFIHPFTDEHMSFEAPLPDDLAEILKALLINS